MKYLDFSTCETLDKSFISEKYKESISDIIHKIKIKQSEIFDREEDKGPISLLLNWFIQLRKHGRIPEEDVDKLERIYESKEEIRAMLITALEKEKQEIFEQGKIAGRQEGKAEGKIEGKAEGKIEGTVGGEIKRQTEIARKMLLKGLGLPLIAELTGLSDTALIQLKQEMEN